MRTGWLTESNTLTIMRLHTMAAILLVFAAHAQQPMTPSVQLAANGAARMSVVVAEGATEQMRQTAADLAAYLGRITGAKFAVSTGDGSDGIAVGTAADFPGLSYTQALAVDDFTDREAYVLKTHADGVHVIGATELAAEHAVWDLLYRAGYRQFFPGAHWEIVPNIPDLEFALNTEERPDYHTRRIWYGYGPWDYAKEPYARWCARNRTRSAFTLSTGHAYGGIIRRNKVAFDANPDFYGLTGGERKSSKICVGNSRLRELVCNYALAQFRKQPGMDSISMDPSDGGGWCECGQCAGLGSITDRALTLANTVAQAINREFNDKYVGMYAYGFHSPPPNIRVHPNVVISIATAFIRGGHTLDELISGWTRQGAAIGIREYYSVHTWDRDLPGRARGSNLDYITRTVREFHRKGARFMSAESSDNWAPNGLGYYVAARILWDIDEASRVDLLIDDFLTRAFGAAKTPMARFYELIDGANRALVAEDQIARMFRLLHEARALAGDPAVIARITDLVLYTRYVELYRSYDAARGATRQIAFEAMIRHAYRMRTSMMIHTKALYRDVPHRDRQITVPDNAAWTVPEPKNPWKSSAPFTDAEVSKFLTDGITAHIPVELDFESKRYSTDLVPAAPLQLPPVKMGAAATGRGERAFYTWIDNVPSEITLRITGGLIKHYRDRGNVKIALWQLGGASATGERETKVAEDNSVPPDGVERTVTLAALQPGLHKIVVSDGRDLTRVAWPPGMHMTFRSTCDEPVRPQGRWHLYFYVPRGTKTIGLYADGPGNLLDPTGKDVLTFGRAGNYYSIPVPEGRDGALWKFHHSAGTRHLMTVPPCLARSPDELLLPKEVVEADTAP